MGDAVDRIGRATRETTETRIEARIDIDGAGTAEVVTGIGFFDHMLTAWTLHGRFDLSLSADGDLEVDQHHTVEDVGIVLGEAFAAAVGQKRGIRRYGTSHVPMDEALVRAVVDLSGRAYVHCDIRWRPQIGPAGMDYALVSEFLWGFARASAATVHVASLTGQNNHHLCEAAFKALGRALDEATTPDPRLADAPPSTKGGFDGPGGGGKK